MVIPFQFSLMSKELATTLKKAYCPRCHTDNEENRIFSVNPDADVCYCPNCMAELKPKDVIEEYNWFITQKIIKADRLLYQDTKFYEAYCSYAHIIEIDPDSVRARFGRILSLIYMSTLRKSHFVDAKLLLQREADQYFHRIRDQLNYAKFLLKVNHALKEYQKHLVRRLTVKERFYSEECVELYFLRLNEIIQVRELLVDELTRIYSKDNNDKINRILYSVQNSLDKDDRLLKERVITADGNRYKFVKFNGRRQIFINVLDEKVNALTRFVKYKLDENEKKGKLISDKIYPDNTHLRSLIRTIVPFIVLFTLTSSGALVLYFFAEEKYKPYLLFGSIGGFGIVLILVILFAVWKWQLNKRRHLID